MNKLDEDFNVSGHVTRQEIPDFTGMLPTMYSVSTNTIPSTEHQQGDLIEVPITLSKSGELRWKK